jgi:hypothetical protein
VCLNYLWTVGKRYILGIGTDKDRLEPENQDLNQHLAQISPIWVMRAAVEIEDHRRIRNCDRSG